MLLHLPLKKKRKMLGFRFHVCEHCNLNCKGCNNFSPLAEHEFVDIAELERDLSRLSSIFNHQCEYIYLSGGEPLLHPDITAVMKITRQAFPECDISVFSNGILLKQQADTFWETCRDFKINILASAYPIKIGIDEIRATAAKWGVKFSWAWGQEENSHDTFVIEPINLAGSSNIKRNFTLCGRANNCITLSHGRLFTCTFAPHVRHFNRYFGKNVAITEADSVNIYDDLTADEILQKMAEPIPACRYCNLKRKSVKWSVSEKNLDEWA
ncbi:MAG: radical SAM protein [Synergistaceae bacterium]|nr:radical SAM protein [Synergistaceae bacterium]